MKVVGREIDGQAAANFSGKWWVWLALGLVAELMGLVAELMGLAAGWQAMTSARTSLAQGNYCGKYGK